MSVFAKIFRISLLKTAAVEVFMDVKSSRGKRIFIYSHQKGESILIKEKQHSSKESTGFETAFFIKEATIKGGSYGLSQDFETLRAYTALRYNFQIQVFQSSSQFATLEGQNGAASFSFMSFKYFWVFAISTSKMVTFFGKNNICTPTQNFCFQNFGVIISNEKGKFGRRKSFANEDIPGNKFWRNISTCSISSRRG